MGSRSSLGLVFAFVGMALGSVYWVRNCGSLLEKFEGVSMISRPPGFTLSLRPQEVLPTLQKCSNVVRGAVVVVAASDSSPLGTTKLNYQVNYLTLHGTHEISTHSRDINVVP
jgi:hypothetical protein